MNDDGSVGGRRGEMARRCRPREVVAGGIVVVAGGDDARKILTRLREVAAGCGSVGAAGGDAREGLRWSMYNKDCLRLKMMINTLNLD